MDIDAKLGYLVRTNESTVTNALRQHAARMREAAKDARAAFQAGQDDAEVKAQQDRSIMTNNGFRMSVQIFEEDAKKAEKVADEIDRLLDDLEDVDDDEPDDEQPIPADFPVRPIQPGEKATTPVTCGECGRTWDDAVPTAYTPAPSARCPFEHWH